MSSIHALQNKVALVIGGTGGIGAASACLFAESGAKVVVTHRPGSKGEAAAAALLKVLPGAVHVALVAGAVWLLGGWLPPLDIWPLNAIPGVFWFLAKVVFVFFMFAMMKALLPRYRYDQLMRLGWKIFLPLSLLLVFLVSGYLMLTRVGVPA